MYIYEIIIIACALINIKYLTYIVQYVNYCAIAGCQKSPNSVVGGVDYWTKIYFLEAFNSGILEKFIFRRGHFYN